MVKEGAVGDWRAGEDVVHPIVEVGGWLELVDEGRL